MTFLSVDEIAEEHEPPINEGLGEQRDDDNAEVASPVGERSSNVTANGGDIAKGELLVQKLMTKLKDFNNFLEDLIGEFDEPDHGSQVIDEGFNDPISVDDLKKRIEPTPTSSPTPPLPPMIDPAPPRPLPETEDSESESNRARKPPGTRKPKPPMRPPRGNDNKG